MLFSIDTNNQHLHKSNTRWLGITFRLSKTYIKFLDNVPYVNGTEEEKKKFYKLRSLENKTVGYKYPEITYTISGTDLFCVQ